jgi:protoheme IX farnesyltransferase
LFFFAHWKAAFWSFFSVFFYVFIYSMWLKRRTPQNIVIGGIAGSTPPLIGWIVASSSTIPSNVNPFDLGSPIPWILFLLIFLWTPPHFWALALYRSGEYGKVNIPMMNEVKGPESTVRQSKMYVIFLFLLGSLPCFWPNSGIPLLWAFMSGGLTLWYAISVWNIDINEPLDDNGRMPKAAKSFFRSLFYLGWMFISIVFVSFIPPEWLGPLGIL